MQIDAVTLFVFVLVAFVTGFCCGVGGIVYAARRGFKFVQALPAEENDR
jgi:hypothetical protein